MALRSAYKSVHADTLVPAAPPTKSMKLNMADADKVSEALEAQFPTIEPKAEPVANTDFVGVVKDEITGKSKGQAVLYKSGSLVLTGVCLDFVWPPKQ